MPLIMPHRYLIIFGDKVVSGVLRLFLLFMAFLLYSSSEVEFLFETPTCLTVSSFVAKSCLKSS